jgi:DNA-binding transcriptional regulator GbsR (MarR family)
MGRIAGLERRIVSLWEDIAEARGFDRVVGTVLCALIVENTPLSQREIAEKTGYSIPTVSKTLKILVPLGSVRRMKEPGKRAMLYNVEMHPLEILSGTLTRWTLTARTMARRMSEIHEELEKARSEDPERARMLLRMLRECVDPIPEVTEIMEKAIEDIHKAMQKRKQSR